jgi:uncharacterized damage-inducible protein DinB
LLLLALLGFRDPLQAACGCGVVLSGLPVYLQKARSGLQTRISYPFPSCLGLRAATRWAAPVVHFSCLAAWGISTMSPAVAPQGKIHALDFKKALLEAMAINEKANQLLLNNIPDVAWRVGKGRTNADIAAHIHHIDLMWLSACEESAKAPAKLPPDKATHQEVQTALKERSDACGSLKQKALDDPAGKSANYKLNLVAFVGYLITLDSHHRGQVTKLARQLGHPVDTKAADGLWGWGSLWHNCGFGRRSRGSSSR